MREQRPNNPISQTRFWLRRTVAYAWKILSTIHGLRGINPKQKDAVLFCRITHWHLPLWIYFWIPVSLKTRVKQRTDWKKWSQYEDNKFRYMIKQSLEIRVAYFAFHRKIYWQNFPWSFRKKFPEKSISHYGSRFNHMGFNFILDVS